MIPVVMFAVHTQMYDKSQEAFATLSIHVSTRVGVWLDTLVHATRSSYFSSDRVTFRWDQRELLQEFWLGKEMWSCARTGLATLDTSSPLAYKPLGRSLSLKIQWWWLDDVSSLEWTRRLQQQRLWARYIAVPKIPYCKKVYIDK